MNEIDNSANPEIKLFTSKSILVLLTTDLAQKQLENLETFTCPTWKQAYHNQVLWAILIMLELMWWSNVKLHLNKKLEQWFKSSRIKSLFIKLFLVEEQKMLD